MRGARSSESSQRSYCGSGCGLYDKECRQSRSVTSVYTTNNTHTMVYTSSTMAAATATATATATAEQCVERCTYIPDVVGEGSAHSVLGSGRVGMGAAGRDVHHRGRSGRRQSHTLAAVTLCILGLLAVGVSAKRAESGGSTYLRFLALASFTYEEGGTADVTVEYKPKTASVALKLCTEHELRVLEGKDELCSNLDVIDCEVDKLSWNGSLAIHHTVQKTSKYLVVLVNCERREEDLNYWFEYTMLNPGGQELDLDAVGLPGVYLAFLIVWSIGLVVWLGNWATHVSLSIPLHRSLTAVPIVKVLRGALVYYYWQIQARTGYMPNMFVLVLTYFSLLIDEAAVLACLALIAYGWCIERPRLSVGEHISIVTMCGALWIGLLLANVSVGMSMVVMGGVYFVVVFVSSRTMWKLRVATAYAEVGPPVGNTHWLPTEPILMRAKYTLIRNFVLAMYVYAIATLLLSAVKAVSSSPNFWGYVLADEIVQTICLAAVGWVFRLYYAASPNDYAALDDDRDGGEGGDGGGAGGAGGAGGFGSYGVPEPAPWEPGMPITIRLPDESSDSGEGVLVGMPVEAAVEHPIYSL